MKKSFIKVALFGALTLATSCFIGCSDYDDDIKNLQGQVDELKSLSIADLESQLKALKDADANLATTCSTLESAVEEIKANLESLTAASEALKTAIDGKVDQKVYDAAIKALNGQCSDLAEKLTEMSAKQAEIDTKADKDEVEKLQTELNNSLTSLRADLEGRIAGIETTLNGMATKAELEAAQKALQDRIVALENGNESLKTATEANKSAIDELSKTVSPLKASIEEITSRLNKAEGTIADLQNSVNTVDSRISTAITNLKLTLDGEIDAIETAYKAADNELSGRIKVLEDSKFKDSEEYTTLTNNVTSLKEEIYGKDGKGGLKQQYEALKSQVDNLFAEGTAENGKLTTAIATQISTALAESGVIKNAIANAISAVTGRVTVLESQVKDLMKQIQSIVFVPQYTDAKGVFVPAYFINNVGGEMSLSFRVSPADKATELADMANKLATTDSPIFSFIVENNALETRAATTEDLAINTITGKEGIIIVTTTPNPDKFLNGEYFPTALKVSTGQLKNTKDSITNITTEYFKVKGQMINEQSASLVNEEYGIDYAQTTVSMVNTDFSEQVMAGSVQLPMTKATIGFDQKLEIYSVNGILIDANGNAVDKSQADALKTYLSEAHFALENNKGVKLTVHDPLDAEGSANAKSIDIKLKDVTFGYNPDGKTPLALYDVTYKIVKESADREYDYKEIKAEPAVWASKDNNAAKDYKADFLISNMTTLYADKNADAAKVLEEMKASDASSKTKYYVTIGKNRQPVSGNDYKMVIDLTKDKGNVTIHMPENYAWTSYVFETVYETSYGYITAKAHLNLSYPDKATFLTAVPARWIENNKIYFVQYDKPAASVEDFDITNVLKGTNANAYEYHADADYTYELLESGNYTNIAVDSDGKITVDGEIKYDNTAVTPAIHLTGKEAIDHVRIKVTVKVAGNEVTNEEFGIQLKYPMPTTIDVSKVNLTYSKSDIKNSVAHNIATGVNMKDTYDWKTDMIKDGKITDYAWKTWMMRGASQENTNKYVKYEILSATQGLTKSDFTISDDGKLSINQINIAQDASVTIKVSTTYKYGQSEATFTIILQKTE